MKLKNKYVVGCLVMWYEVEMFPEYIKSCVQMMEGIENPENVTFDFCFNFQEHFEKIDWEKLNERFNLNIDFSKNVHWSNGIRNMVDVFVAQFPRVGNNIVIDWKGNNQIDSGFYNIAWYRRKLNHNYCEKVDYVLWGETDSLWPDVTLQCIENVHETLGTETPKFILSFASRVNWDSSWNITRHPLYENIEFQDNDEWVLNNEASEKSYMSIERMNEINCNGESIELLELHEPKADGSCLVISSELIKSGVNIPHALLHCGEDESFLRQAKLVMGSNFRQYLVKNVLRVHNRRHPKKRMYIKNEDNPRGFCDERKGDWWKKLENSSKYNLENLRLQKKFIKIEEVL